MKGQYTEAVHAARLLRMLERKNPCACCPATRHFWTADDHIMMDDVNRQWPASRDNPCDVCCQFVDSGDWCPCYRLGSREAIKRTWLALEERGYLE